MTNATNITDATRVVIVDASCGTTAYIFGNIDDAYEFKEEEQACGHRASVVTYDVYDDLGIDCWTEDMR